MNRSSESTSIVNSQQENEDILDKLTPEEKHQEMTDKSDHPEGTDVTKLSNTSHHPQEPEITKPSEISDNAKDTDSIKVENESNKPEGTDLVHTKSDYKPTECTQRYGCETEGQLNSTVQCNEKKVLKLTITLDRPHSVEKNPDGNRVRDCRIVYETQLQGEF
ncbi:uncharacterized protein LOC119962986 [Scyliorhinus canicula]|uniref:uncharacterized protein LOC119962986 n=1 Tax=Scyliorhinus canicula TaxID=7830 RepID=UPI0018F6A12C|nr:uncharacterized protein LOC119962986 [Scyliorhinus canicula]